MDQAVPFCVPDAKPMEESESWNESYANKQSDIKFERLKIKLRRPLTTRKHLDDGYNLPFEDKGCALILSSKVKRNGSDKDMENLDKLLTMLGYKVFKYDLFYSDESDQVESRLSTILANFKSQITAEVKSIVVFIGSHGNFGSFQTSDGKHLDFLTELVYKFSHRHCPQLKGKPKLFLAQFCQDFKAPVPADEGQISYLVSKFNDFFIEKLQAQQENDSTYITDAIICQSSLPGFEAVRNKQIGSVFVHCFCKVVMESAYKMDLWSMMHPVGEEMQKFYRYKHKGYKLTPTPSQYHAKKVYFNLAPNLNVIPGKLDFYINRKIKPEDIISGKILRHKCPDIFVFQLNKLGRAGLSNLLKNEVTVVSSDCKQFIPSRFILLEKHHHFYKIGKIAKETPVHLLQEVNGNGWKWIMSNGSVEEIQKFARKSTDPLKEATFLSNIYSSNLTQAICVVGKPGMGKSSLLAEIGRKLTTHYPDRLVLFLQMKDFVSKVKNMSGYNFQVKIQATLRKFLRENHLDDEEFDQVISGSSDGIQFELLLDGFDESEDVYLAHQILQLIKRAYSSVRIWITSRSHFQQELERTLEVPAFKLSPFTTIDRISYLSSFWFLSRNKRLPGNKEEEEKIKELNQLKCFADYLLKSIESCTKTRSRHSAILADTPLLCKLIGSVYEEEAVEFLTTNKLPGNYSKISSIGNLFQSYISKSLEKCENERGEEMHVRLALEMSFGFEKMQEVNLPLAPVDMSDILKVGILESANTPNSPQFIHATFKEYFLAWFPLHMFQTFPKDSAKIKTLLTRYIFEYAIRTREISDHFSIREDQYVTISGFANPIIAYFFDFLLPHFQVPPSIQLEIEEFSPQYISIIYESCINSNYLNIFRFISSLKQKKNIGSKIFTTELLCNAAGKCNLEFFKVVLTKFQEFHKLDLQTKENLLVSSTGNGNYEVLEFLLNVKRLRFIVEKMKGKNIRLLLHKCVMETEKESHEEISKRMEILHKLVNINRSLLEEKDSYEITPLLCDGVHIRLLQELIRLGGNVLAQDRNKCNILHLNYNRKHLTGEEFHKLITSISDKKLRKLVRMKDIIDIHPYFQEYIGMHSNERLQAMQKTKGGETPLMTFIRWHKTLPRTLEKFYEAGADFNATNKLNYSVLAHAISRKRCGRTILKLIELGADVNWRGCNGESILHVGACRCNVDAIKALLDRRLMSVNDKDANGRTPLDYIVESRYNNRNKGFLKTGMELYKRGGKLAHVGPDSKLWLHVAVEEADLEFVVLLLEFGMDINEQDELGNTAIHALMLTWITFNHYRKCEKYCKIFSEFLQRNVNMAIKNKAGITPIRLALQIKRMDFKTFKLFLSKAEMEWTDETATLGLKFLVSTSTSEAEFRTGVKELEKHQPNFSFVDEEGNSLLHLCVENIKWKERMHLEAQLGKWRALGSPDPKRSWMSDLNMIKYLIRNGVDVFKKNRKGLTFLYDMIREGRDLSPTDFCSLTNYLNKKGYLDLFNIQSRVGQVTPFQIAVLKVAMEQETLALFKAKGVNFNVIDKNGNSVLFYAAQSHSKKKRELISTLINFGADWKHRNNQKESFLHVAVTSSSTEPLRFILEELKLDVNEKDVEGNTPLHCYVIDKSFLDDNKIELLVEYGADVNVKNNEGLTPVELAISLERKYASELLTKLSK